MGIESNKEAVAMMKNTLGSIENRFREAYNKGYKDGLRDGASQVTAKLVSKILEETEADTPQTFAKPSKCLGCLYSDLDKAFHPCASCVDFSKYVGEVSGDTPQTEREGE